MKCNLGILALFLIAGTARADELRLTDGTKLSGWYVGGTQTDIWFQPVDQAARSIPLEMVDALTFRPLWGAPTPDGSLEPRLPGRSGQPRTSLPPRVHPPGNPGEAWRAPAVPKISPGP